MTIHESISVKAAVAKNADFNFTLMDLSALLRGRESQANNYRSQAYKLAGEMAQRHFLDINVEPITGETDKYMFASCGDNRAEMDAFSNGCGFLFGGPAEYDETENFTYRYLAAV